MGFAVNQVIGNYECLGIIDKPKAGVTYKVRNLATGEIESMRTLPGTTSRQPEMMERLLREIRIQTRLSHPNIVEFHDAFEIDGRLVMTTEFVDAPTLAERCRRRALPAHDAIAAIDQVLDGLEQAHALGIVHRGITAEHITLTPENAVKLSGFDLAKPTCDSNLTAVGVVAGDPRYVSPEQVTGQSAVDARSDLYSVGILLYQTLTGKLPFDGATEIEVLTAQVTSEPLPPSAVNPAISSELDQIVLKALKKDPNQRFANAQEFRDALPTDCIPSLAEPAVSHANPRSTTPDMPSRGGWFRAPLVFGFLAAAAAATIVWFTIH